MQSWTEALHGSGVIEPTDQEHAASLSMMDLEQQGKVEDYCLFTLENAKEVLVRIAPPVEREIVWAKRIDADDEPPAETALLGYEPSMFFPGYCESPIADWLFFNDWPEHDEEGQQFKTYHEKLNRWGLFDSPKEAEQFLEAYLTFLPKDWDEHNYGYYIVEVRALADE